MRMTNTITTLVSSTIGFIGYELATTSPVITESSSISIGLIITLITICGFVVRRFTKLEDNVNKVNNKLDVITNTLSKRPCMNPEVRDIICPINRKSEEESDM